MPPFRNLLSAALLASASLATAKDNTPFDPLADAREFDPGRLREWSRNSIQILETYRDYKKSFVGLRPQRYDSLSKALVDKEETWFFLLEGNRLSPVLMNGPVYGRARTDKGNLEVDVQKSYGAAHAGYRARGWEAGAYAIIDMLDLRAEEKSTLWHSDLFQNQKGEGLLLFRAGKTILAGYEVEPEFGERAPLAGDFQVDSGPARMQTLEATFSPDRA